MNYIPLAKRESRRLPTVLTREETLRVIGFLPGTYQLMAKLLYGCGLRLRECLQLRVKDIDFERHQIVVRAGKRDKDRVTMLPASVVPFLQERLRHVEQLPEQDLCRGYGRVDLPFALDRKYPRADREWPTSSTAAAWPCAARWTEERRHAHRFACAYHSTIRQRTA